MVGGHVPDYWRVRDPDDDELPKEKKKVVSFDEVMDNFDKRESEQRGDNVVIEVLEENEITVTVFQLCQWTVLTGIGAFYQGISALEIESVLRMLNIDQSKWHEVVIGIKSYMVPSAQKQLNKEKK